MRTIGTFDRHGGVASGTGLGARMLAFVWNFGRMMERSRTRKALLELSDHQLKDIGLSRSEAYREGSRRFWE